MKNKLTRVEVVVIGLIVTTALAILVPALWSRATQPARTLHPVGGLVQLYGMDTQGLVIGTCSEGYRVMVKVGGGQFEGTSFQILELPGVALVDVK